MGQRFSKLIFFLVLISALVLPKFFILQRDSVLILSFSNGLILAQTAAEERQALETELQQLQDQIAQYDKDITKTSQEKKTLQNQITLLKNQISKLNLQINQGTIMIKDLNLQIKDTENSIQQTSDKITASRRNLGGILQQIYESNQKSLVEVLFSETELSNFFDDLASLESLVTKSQELLNDIKDLKISLEAQQVSLDDEKTSLEKVVQVQTLQKQQNESNKKQQEYFLKLTEAQYQKSLQDKTAAQQKADEIRKRIFELIGVPEAPTFGEALDFANYVYQLTGVKPALLLAVLTQESNIGKNVGQCFLKNLSTGSGVKASSNGTTIKNVMNPTRDVSYFLTITKNLGRDPLNTPVSCPMSVGYGGGMGPAQFIPSTWVLYQDKFSAAKGGTVDPWNIKDAFLAAGVYLKDLGVLTNEFKAVMRYFSGATWSKWEEFYGNSVLSLKAKYQEDINALSGS